MLSQKHASGGFGTLLPYNYLSLARVAGWISEFWWCLCLVIALLRLTDKSDQLAFVRVRHSLPSCHVLAYQEKGVSLTWQLSDLQLALRFCCLKGSIISTANKCAYIGTLGLRIGVCHG